MYIVENRQERYKKHICIEWENLGEKDCRGAHKIRTAHSVKAETVLISFTRQAKAKLEYCSSQGMKLWEEEEGRGWEGRGGRKR